VEEVQLFLFVLAAISLLQGIVIILNVNIKHFFSYI